MIYDLIVEEMGGPADKHSRIIPMKGWNEILAPWDRPGPETVVGHTPYPPHRDNDTACQQQPSSRPCKYKGVRYFWDRVRPRACACAACARIMQL